MSKRLTRTLEKRRDRLQTPRAHAQPRARPATHLHPGTEGEPRHLRWLMIGLQQTQVIMVDAQACGEAPLALLKRRRCRQHARRHRHLDCDRQERPPPPMPPQLEATPQDGAGILAVGPDELAHQTARVVIEAAENFGRDDYERDLAGPRDVAVDPVLVCVCPRER